jgi:PilZ domain
MHAPKVADRRHSQRPAIDRVAQIQVGAGALPRDCVIADISTGGVKLKVDGFDVPDDFVLILSADGVAKECNYQVVWRLGDEVGARFVSFTHPAPPRPLTL